MWIADHPNAKLPFLRTTKTTKPSRDGHSLSSAGVSWMRRHRAGKGFSPLRKPLHALSNREQPQPNESRVMFSRRAPRFIAFQGSALSLLDESRPPSLMAI